MGVTGTSSNNTDHSEPGEENADNVEPKYSDQPVVGYCDMLFEFLDCNNALDEQALVPEFLVSHGTFSLYH